MPNPLATRAETLTPAEFRGLEALPAEAEWLANIRNARTRRAYRHDVEGFCRFAGITSPEAMRRVTRPHVIAWRTHLEQQGLAGASIRRKLSALASLFDHLCECNVAADNPVRGVQRPPIDANEGKTPALSDAQARLLLDAPPADTLKGQRDRAILATLLYHGLRREELCRLRLRDIQSREGVIHLRVTGKRDKMRFIPASPHALRLIEAYLAEAGHGDDPAAPLFQPLHRNRDRAHGRALDPQSVYENVVRHYGGATGLNELVGGLCVHSLRATAATNALQHDADIGRVQEWLGHASIATTRLYDRRGTRPEESPTFRVKY